MLVLPTATMFTVYQKKRIRSKYIILPIPFSSLNMSLQSIPVKRSAGGHARNSKANTPSLLENGPVQDGVASVMHVIASESSIGNIASNTSNCPRSPVPSHTAGGLAGDISPSSTLVCLETSGGIMSPTDVTNSESQSSPISRVSCSKGANRSKFMTNVPVNVRTSLVTSEATSPELAVGNAHASPGSNRSRFMSNCQPLKVCCDLSTIGVHNSSVRFSFEAIVLVVYPASKSPDRRQVQLIDARGSTGITIWGENVHLFSSATVGQVAKFSKLSLVFNNGKKMLSMSRDSSVVFPNTIAVPTEESKWWKDLLLHQPLRIIDVHDCAEDTVINVSGILGLMWTDTKKVKDQNKDLLNIRLTDRTGFVDVRSWSHSEAEFAAFVEQPILLRRVRVTSFAGIKILELLDGSGTQLRDEFDGYDDLLQYWQE